MGALLLVLLGPAVLLVISVGGWLCAAALRIVEALDSWIAGGRTDRLK